MPKYILTVNLAEEDPSEVLDWLIETSGDENACVETYPAIRKPATDRDGIEQVTAALVRDGWVLHHVEHDDEVRVNTIEEAVAEVTAVDDAYLVVAEGTRSGTLSWVRFVLGNDPEEVVCDYTLSLSSTINPITENWSN